MYELGYGPDRDDYLWGTLYLGAIELELRIATRAFARLRVVLESYGALPSEVEEAEGLTEDEFGAAEARLREQSIDLLSDVWADIFLVLSSVANVSKMFLLSGAAKGDRRAVARAERLRELLLIGDAAEWSRDVRDALEHFDERLDAWADERPFYWSDRTVVRDDAPALEVNDTRLEGGWVVQDPPVRMKSLRNLDPETFVVTVHQPTGSRRAWSVSLLDVMSRVAVMRERVNALLAELWESNWINPQPPT